MGASFLITLREGLEVSLVLAIVLAYLAKTGRRSLFPAVAMGAGIAALVCLVAGVAFHLAIGEFEGKADPATAVRGLRIGLLLDAGWGLPLDADIAFHSAVLAASNNRFLLQLTEFISTALRVSIRYTNRIKGVPGADVQKHGDILRAIQARDPKQARHTVEVLLEDAIQLIESKLE